MRNLVLGMIVGVGLMALVSSSYADCTCPNCSADPVFIQPDHRQADKVEQLRKKRADRVARTEELEKRRHEEVDESK